MKRTTPRMAIVAACLAIAAACASREAGIERVEPDAAVAQDDARDSAQVEVAGLDAVALSAGLAPDEAGVVFARHVRWSGDGQEVAERDEMSAFVLRCDRPPERVALGACTPIEQAVAAWRAALHDDRAADDEAAARVRRLVFDPVLPALGGATTLVVVPDDMLHTVPLDALPLDGGLLGERFSFTLHGTLATLVQTGRRPGPARAERGLVALGGADFDAPGAGGAATADAAVPPGPFAPLMEADAEARGIGALYDEAFGGDTSVVLRGAEATADALAGHAQRARFLHVATHGWFAPAETRAAGSSPLILCGLALAGANRPPDDAGRRAGVLTGEDIAGWGLSRCELAVLSASDTNIGIRRAGQGVASLQKALHMAGARSVITSLWKVPDEATKTLMLDFYRRLWVDGKPTRQALWEAKMALRDAKDPDGTPTYAMRDWAGWVLTGG